jgi:hypothetical protein
MVFLAGEGSQEAAEPVQAEADPTPISGAHHPGSSELRKYRAFTARVFLILKQA